MKLKMLLLLVVVLLLPHKLQANECVFRSIQIPEGNIVYLSEIKNGVQICVIASCTIDPLPNVEESEVICSVVNVNCSVASNPHDRNVSICCQHCGECDFLTCPENSQCVESSINGASCQCLLGYQEVMSSGELACRDIDECASNTHNCPTASDCINVPGTYNCSCYSGYHGNTCTDVNECLDFPSICQSSSQCVNHEGSYECVCSEECNLNINSYYLTTPSDPDSFFTQNPSCSLVPLDSSMVVCAGQQQLLTDKSTEGSVPPTASEYVGWDRTQETLDGFTMIINSNYTRLTRLDIYFYNYPAAGIGLPEVSSIYVSNSSQANGSFVGPLPFVYASNEDLSQDDNGMRMVSIIITGNNDGIGFYRFVQINFIYSSSLIWRSQLTEIQGYGGTDTNQMGSEITFLSKSNQVIHLGVDNIVSQVDLKCTVANPGSFLWEWTRTSDGVILSSEVNQADLTRTSILTVNNLSIESSGEYTCRAFYSDESLAFEGTATIILELLYEVIKEIPKEPISGRDVTVSCEFIGYYPKEGSVVEWDFEGKTVSNNDNKYAISSDTGSEGQSQHGGSSLDPSLISSLTISTVEEEDIGIYGCRIIGSYDCSQLIGYIHISTVSSSSVSLLSPSAEPNTSITNSEIWFYLFVTVIVIDIIIGIIILVFVIFTARHKHCPTHAGKQVYKQC